MSQRLAPTPIILGRGETIRPILDQVLIHAHDWHPSGIIQVVGRQMQPVWGTVVAVGPGASRRKYRNPDGLFRYDGRRRNFGGELSQESVDYRWSSHFWRTVVKAGDVVELGGEELDGYLHKLFIIDNALHVLCREPDIAGIREMAEVA